MSDVKQLVHISSAVIQVLPHARVEVSQAINDMQGCEVVHQGDTKLVAILEGPTSGAVGDLLSQIALFDGVLSAGLVYEQVEPLEALGEPI